MEFLNAGEMSCASSVAKELNHQVAAVPGIGNIAHDGLALTVRAHSKSVCVGISHVNGFQRRTFFRPSSSSGNVNASISAWWFRAYM